MKRRVIANNKEVRVYMYNKPQIFDNSETLVIRSVILKYKILIFQ